MKFSALVFILLASFTGFAQNPSGGLQLIEADKGISILYNETILLQYNTAFHYPPGADSVYKKSGFIHPLRSLNGAVLTAIHPADHRHHYGLWHAWTNILYKGRSYDLWNLHLQQGTVRFKKIHSRSQSANTATFTVINENLAFIDGREELLFQDRQKISIRKLPGENFYTLDIDLTLYQFHHEILHDVYRYGGLVFRANEQWNAATVHIVSDAGKDRDAADSSRAKWVILEGGENSKRAGIVFMSNPKNFDHPQLMRVWPSTMMGDGKLMFNFSPIKGRSWSWQPGKEYLLKYRLLIYDGSISAREAELAWQRYSNE